MNTSFNSSQINDLKRTKTIRRSVVISHAQEGNNWQQIVNQNQLHLEQLAARAQWAWNEIPLSTLVNLSHSLVNRMNELQTNNYFSIKY